MQREIEALLAAYIDDRKKEAKLIHELLTALSVGAAGRQRMFDAIAALAGPHSGEALAEAIATPARAASASPAPLTLVDDLTISINTLRQARDQAFTH